MASWNSIPLEITSEVFGWICFSCWAVGFYPQVILNFRRKSVVGLNFDYVVLQLVKQCFYLIYNATLYFSSDVQKQYFDKYGHGETIFRFIKETCFHARSAGYLFHLVLALIRRIRMIPVAFNDIAFSTHSLLLKVFTLYQIAIYERGAQTVSRIAIVITIAVLLTAGVCFFIALPTHSWLWLISIFNSIQIFLTLIKYIPQAFMNFTRKSTVGFSIGIVLFDFTGGVADFAQMAVQSIDQGFVGELLWKYGEDNALFGMITIFFDLVFMCQHFLLYPAERVLIPPKTVEESKEPLITKSSGHPTLENV